MNQMTEHVLRNNYTTLLYLEDPATFDASKGLDGQDAGPYRICLQMPTAEFIGRTPMEITAELVKHTTDGEWRETRQRSIQPGDLVVVGMQPWLVVSQKNTKAYPMNLLQRTDVWPEGAIDRGYDPGLEHCSH
jgi:hypothetical protein